MYIYTALNIILDDVLFKQILQPKPTLKESKINVGTYQENDTLKAK